MNPFKNQLDFLALIFSAFPSPSLITPTYLTLPDRHLSRPPPPSFSEKTTSQNRQSDARHHARDQQHRDAVPGWRVHAVCHPAAAGCWSPQPLSLFPRCRELFFFADSERQAAPQKQTMSLRGGGLIRKQKTPCPSLKPVRREGRRRRRLPVFPFSVLTRARVVDLCACFICCECMEGCCHAVDDCCCC